MRKKVTFLNFYKLTFRITYEAIFINVNIRSSIPSADRLGTTTTSIEGIMSIINESDFTFLNL